ncbi:hypothetical protein JTB14_027550 [Gonioctena quinquepunctata]|nr:hypothetical protein JTB14_027550 [Gonioctena quinquepunctata]
MAHAGGLLSGGYGIGGGWGMDMVMAMEGSGYDWKASGILVGVVLDVDMAPPKYEYQYGVEDGHTGDYKQQQESRIGDLTHSDYGLAEKDRKIQVSRVIASSVPVARGHGYY